MMEFKIGDIVSKKSGKPFKNGEKIDEIEYFTTNELHPKKSDAAFMKNSKTIVTLNTLKIKEKMSKFITPVSMKVTREEFNYLEKELEKLGYESSLIGLIYPVDNYIATNLGNTNNLFSNIDNETINRHDRYYIDSYNPELFLALAAMTDNYDPIVREYMICIYDTVNCEINSKVGDIIKILSFNDNSKWKPKQTEKGHFGTDWSRNHYRKATKEELISHFSKDTFVLPERWVVKADGKGPIGKYFDKQCNTCIYDFRDGYYHRFGKNGDDITNPNKLSNLQFHSYSIIDDHTEITQEQFEKYVLNSNNKQTKIKMKHTITLDQLRLIFNVACANWQEKIKVYAGRAVFPQVTVDFTNDEVKTMYSASNSEQKAVLDSIFTEYNKDNNPFIEHKDNAKLIAELSNTCFGGSDTIELSQSIISMRKLPSNLRNRSFFVRGSYQVILHEKEGAGTIIEFQKR